MIATIDEFRIPVVRGQENLDALLMQQLLKSFDELLTVDENGMTTIDSINLPDINYVDSLRVVNQQRVRAMMQTVARATYNDFEYAYNFRNKKFVPFEDYDDLQFDIELAVSSILYLYDELLSKPVVKMNVSNTSKVIASVAPAQALRVLVNDAQQQINFHTKDIYKDLRKTTRSIISNGIQYEVLENGSRKTQRMTDVVDKLMLNAISSVQKVVFKHVDKDIQFDGIEISVHVNSALDHAPVQGHQFSQTEFDKLQNGSSFSDYQGHSFASIGRPIGMWNCRHVTYPILLGVTKQTFSQEELDELNNDLSKPVNIGTETLSKADAVALKNRLEKKMLRYKEASLEAGLFGDNELSQEFVKKYLKYKRLFTTVSNSLHNI